MSHRGIPEPAPVAEPMRSREPDRAVDGPMHPRFDFNDSDITLWSCERVGFRVHKARLASASLFFHQMFDGTLGLKTPSEDATQLAEPADTLAVLFAMCYPFYPHDAPFELFSESLDIALLISCYEASEKYGMWVARQVMEHRVMQLVPKDPFRLVRTGYVLRNQALLTAAAHATLRCNILGDGAKYREKAGNTWASLLEYYLAYQRLVISTLHSMPCTLFNDWGEQMERETGKYRCPKPAVTADDIYYCETARSYQGHWRDDKYRLSNMLSAEWPAAALRSSIDAYLGDPKILSCTGCTSTWKEMRERVAKLKPSLTLTLEDIDRARDPYYM